MNSQFTLSAPFLYTFLASLIFLFLITKRKNNSKQTKRLPLPPGPPKLPILGNLHQLKHPLHRTLHDLSKQYGDLMLLQLGRVPTLVVSSADMTREIIKNHDVAFGGRAARQVTRRTSYDCTDIVFAPYGEYWREVRKVAVFELLSPKRVQTFSAVREEEVALLLDSVARSNSAAFDLSELLHALSNNVLCRVAFGRKFHGRSNGMKSPQELLEETQNLVGTINLSDSFPSLWWLNKLNGFDARVDKTVRELDEVYDVVIKEHLDPNRPQSDQEDLVDVLLRLHKDPTQLVSKNKNFVKALISDMFIAGTDTAGATMIWSMTELVRHPFAMKRAQEEVRKMAKGKPKVEESDLPQLPYIRSVVKETLRLHPPTPLMIPRETLEDCEVKGYRIPAKTTVFINAHSMAMDPKSWENPSEFRPERFLDSSVDFRGQHYELIPFGIGRRSCPGINFATVVLELAIANLLYRFDWSLPKGVTEVDMEEALGIVVLKKTPLFLVATPVNV